MGFDQKGSSVFRIVRGDISHWWSVMEEGFDKPLATFDAVEDAHAYANHLATTKAGSKVFDEHGNPLRDKGDTATALHR